SFGAARPPLFLSPWAGGRHLSPRKNTACAACRPALSVRRGLDRRAPEFGNQLCRPSVAPCAAWTSLSTPRRCGIHLAPSAGPNRVYLPPLSSSAHNAGNGFASTFPATTLDHLRQLRNLSKNQNRSFDSRFGGRMKQVDKKSGSLPAPAFPNPALITLAAEQLRSCSSFRRW